MGYFYSGPGLNLIIPKHPFCHLQTAIQLKRHSFNSFDTFPIASTQLAEQKSYQIHSISRKQASVCQLHAFFLKRDRERELTARRIIYRQRAH
jgi:hypothetical protein